MDFQAISPEGTFVFPRPAPSRRTIMKQQVDKSKLINLLPKDGIVNFYGQAFSEIEANHFFKQLMETVKWARDELTIFGKKVITKREVAWYGDKSYQYTYSNSSKLALAWTKELQEIKTIVEEISKETYNTCLLNLYHSGEEGMGWHSDDESELKPNGAIASVSFGATRKFVLKHNQTKEKVEVMLDNGSLLVMKGETQTFWKHAVPKTKKVMTPRINLTFRTIVS